MLRPVSVQIVRFESFRSHNHVTVINLGMTEIKMRFKLSCRLKESKCKFIVESSPWRGVWWERLIRNVKEPLRKILGKALLSYAELTTVLTQGRIQEFLKEGVVHYQ